MPRARAAAAGRDERKGVLEMAEKQQIPDDEFARDSFSLRRMTQGQVWALTVIGVAILVALLVFASQ
jgi:hypothetical protein